MKKYTKTYYLAVYASYAFTFYGQMILPRAFSETLVDTISPKFLLGYSNIPGPIKPLFYESEDKKRRHYCVSSQVYMICSGKVGLSVVFMSFAESFTIGVCADNNVLNKENTTKFCRYLYESLNNEKLRV